MKNAPSNQSDILVVDDNVDDLTVLRSILMEQGYHVRTAINGNLALNSVREKAPNLILLDIRLPGIDGYQVCKQLKANDNPAVANIPIIFISALDETLNKVKAFSVGGVDYIPKPFEREEIVARIQTHLGLRQVQADLTKANIELQQEIKERERAESALRENQRMLTTLMGNLPGMAYRCLNDAQWTMQFVSEGCRPLTGYEPNELLYNQFVRYGELIHPDDREMVWQEVQTAVSQDQPFQITYRLRTHNGAEKLVQEQGRPVITPDSDHPFLEGFISDITQEAQAKSKLQESVARWESLVQHVPYFIAIMDRDNILHFVNHLYPGFNMEEVIGTSNYDYIDPRYHELVKQKVQHVFTTRQSVTYELEAVGENQTTVWYETRVSPLILDDEVAFVTMISQDITERKQTEAALQESEERFRMAFNQQFQFMAILSPEGKILEINDLPIRVQGFRREDYVGNYFWQAPPWQTSSEWQAKIKSQVFKAKAQEETLLTEDIFYTADGKIRYADAAYTAVRSEQSNVQFILVQATDITERKQTEIALQENATFLRSIFDNSINAIMVADDAGSYISVNQAAAEMFGYPVEALLQMNVGDLRTVAGPDAAERYRQYLARGREIGEFDFMHANGEPRIAQYHAVRIDSNFNLSILVDITERKQIEEDLRQREAHYRRLFEYVPDGILIADQESYYLDANPKMCTMLGFTREELVGLHARDIVVPQEIEYVEPALAQINAGSDYFRVWQFRRKDGSVFWAEVKVTTMPDNNLLAMVHDITERQQAEAALRQSEARLSVVFNHTTDLQLLWTVEPDNLFRVAAINKPYIQTGKSFGINISAENFVGKTLPEALSFLGLGQDVIDYTLKNYIQAATTGKLVEYTESITLEAGPYHSEITLIPVMDENGNCLYVLYNSHNMTELKQTAEKLHQLNSELDERVRERTSDLNKLVQLMAGREVRMAELKQVIKQLRSQLQDAGMKPIADDPLIFPE